MNENYKNINFEQESGRSMVEMLGVLAIIGVLSVGGISGYTTAMNKHKANEILNAAAVRAMAVSAQIQSGVDPSTATGSVTSEPIGSAEIGSASPVNADQFKLVFTSNIDGPICDQMKNIAGENSVVGVACNRLLYNNDMSPGVENKNIDSVDENGVYTCKTAGFDPDSKCESCKTGYTGLSCNTCAEGYEDNNGVCDLAYVSPCSGGSSETDPGSGVPFEVETQDGETITCYCRSGESFQNGQCATAPTTACTHYDTNECGLGYYCRFKDATGLDCQANGDGQPIDGSSQPVQGTCTPITNALKNEATGKWYYSNEYLDWFSAYSWCKGKGRPGLITFSTLTAIARTKNATADVKSGYDGSSLDYPLYNAFGGDTGSFPQDAYWTNTCTNTTSGCNTSSCYAYSVLVSSDDEYVTNLARDRNYSYALCE